MMIALIFINTSLLLLLSFIHIYWLFGGKWGIVSAIPDQFVKDFFNEKHRTRINVSIFVVSFGLIVLSLINSLNFFRPDVYWVRIVSRIIGVLFILRAIGDFKMFGIFKKRSNSKFAESDSKLFIPLCFFIGISSIIITLH